MWSSLFVSGAGLLLLAAALFPGPVYHWSATALLALACVAWGKLPANALSAITVLYCAWHFVNAVFITPAYSSASVYRPVVLLGAFAALAMLGRAQAINLFRAGLTLLAALVFLGLTQVWFGAWHLPHNPQRAAATFVTPNTFAAAINLFLLPLAAHYLTTQGTARILILLLWLFAGLVASESRGGMLAFLAGLGFAATCIGWQALWQARRRVLVLFAGWIAVWMAVAAAGTALAPAGSGDTVAASPLAAWAGRGTAERPKLYGTTLHMILDHPIAGTGANTFFPLFESVKPESLRGAEYSFVHNDYLQHWLEFGAPGGLLLLLLALAALVLARRAFRRDRGDPLPLACGAALASCFAHSVVDFPLFVPFIVFVVGGYLGALAAHLDKDRLPGSMTRWAGRVLDAITPRIRWVLALAALAWLAQPALAELATQRSLQALMHGSVRDGIYWQSVARRLEPRLAAHYWTEAMIWRETAVDSKNPELAAKADALFVEGIRADPYDVANLLARAGLHRRHPQLMREAASPAEVLSWAERAAKLRPQNLTVQAEFARTLAYAGQPERARTLARLLLEQYPDSEFARRLTAEF